MSNLWASKISLNVGKCVSLLDMHGKYLGNFVYISEFILQIYSVRNKDSNDLLFRFRFREWIIMHFRAITEDWFHIIMYSSVFGIARFIYI